MNPLVSIIVPSFNHGRFVGRTLHSILSQDYRPIEVIVVDGGSSDDTDRILAGYAARYPELRWVSEKDNGVADAVNKGLAMAKGEIAAIQSSDDMYYAAAIRTAVEAFQQHPKCGLVYGESDSVDVDDRILSHYQVPDFSWPAIFGISMCLPQQAVFFRMSVARAAGGWNDSYFGCDLDYWLRLMLRAPALRVPFTFSAWRTYPEQRTQPSQYAKIWHGYWRMIADCEELKAAPASLRSMARASCHLMALRYHPTGNLWVLRWHALCALLLFPTFPRYCPPWLLKPLIPGFTPLRKVYRRLKPLPTAVPGPRVVPGAPRVNAG